MYLWRWHAEEKRGDELTMEHLQTDVLQTFGNLQLEYSTGPVMEIVKTSLELWYSCGPANGLNLYKVIVWREEMRAEGQVLW